MRKYLIIISISFWIAHNCLCQNNSDNIYKDDSVCTEYFDTVICDPYQWLEDLNSNRTLDWLNIQNVELKKYSRKLVAINRIYDKLLEYSYLDYRSDIKKGGYYFEFRNSLLERTASLYIKNNYDGTAKLLIDSKEFSDNRSDIVTIEGFEVSKDKKYIALALSYNGRDWRTIRVMRIDGREILNDKIENVKFSNIQWFGDGFFYVKYDQPTDLKFLVAKNDNPQLFYHELGKDQDTDVLICELAGESNSRILNFNVSDNEKYLFVSSSMKGREGETIVVSYYHLDSINQMKQNALITVKHSGPSYFSIIAETNGKVLVKSDFNCNKSCIYEYDLFNNNLCKVLIPAQPEVLESVVYANNKLICKYYDEGKYSLIIYDSQGNGLIRYNYPTGNDVGNFQADEDDVEIIFSVRSFYSPPKVYRLDLETLKIESCGKTTMSFKTSNYATDYVKYISKEGTEIPMYLTCKKGLKRTVMHQFYFMAMADLELV